MWKERRRLGVLFRQLRNRVALLWSVLGEMERVLAIRIPEIRKALEHVHHELLVSTFREA